MTPIDRITHELELRGCRPKRRGSSIYAKCPVHGGNDYDSLSVGEGADGRALMTCHSKGCSFAAIMDALDLEMADAFPEEQTTTWRGSRVGLRPSPEQRFTMGEPESVYDYVDADGVLLFQVLRYRTESGKTFRQRRPAGDEWIWGLGDVERPLYRLPRVLDAIEQGQPVYLVEGEKDVETLEGLGLVATCSLGGSCERTSSWDARWTEQLRGAEVIVLPDNDEPGRRHAQVVRQAIADAVKRVRVVELPGLPEKGDVSDWVEAGGTREELERLCIETRLKVLTLAELFTYEFPPKKPMMAPWLHSQDLVLVYAARGVGKTQFLVGLSLALITGADFLGWKSHGHRGVLYVDGEMPGTSLTRRVRKLAQGMGGDAQTELEIITPDAQNYGIRPLSTRDGQLDLLEVIRPDHDVIILDNLACLVGGNESDPAEWDMMQTFLLKLRQMGHAVIMAHHAGKGGNQRGTSHREDVLDTVIQLRHPGDYEADQGCRFSTRFEKARNLEAGRNPEVEAHLRPPEDGEGLVFTFTSLENARYDQMVQMYNDGMKQADIASELGLNQSSVSRRLRAAKAAGLLVSKRGRSS